MNALRRLSLLALFAAMLLACGLAAAQSEPCKNHFILSPSGQKCDPGVDPAEPAQPPANKSRQGNYQGLWWGGPSESGWNLNFAHQDDAIFALWATYDEAGKATWFSMTAALSGPDTFSGTLYKSRVPVNTNPWAYDPARLSAADVGTATIAFSSAGEGTFTYRMGGVERAKRIVRFGVDPAGIVCTWQGGYTPKTNATDIWYSSALPGSAFAVLHIPSTIYFTWFTYDWDGSPTWFSGVGFDVYGDYDSWAYLTTGPSYLAPQYDPAAVRYVGYEWIELETDWKYNLTLFESAYHHDLTRYVFRGSGTTCETR